MAGFILPLECVVTGMATNYTAQPEPAEDVIGNLYGQYYDKMVRYIYVRTGDQAEAEDLAVEVFLKALKSLGSYRGRGEQMPAWLFRIAHNLVVDHGYAAEVETGQRENLMRIQLNGN